MNRWSVALTLLAPVLSSCNPPSPTRAQPPTGDTAAPRPVAFVVPAAHPQASVVIEGVPHIKQKPDFCGEACVEMALRKLGHPLDQDEVFNRSGLDPAQGRGVATAELKTALERIGFEPGAVWSTLSASAPAPGLEAAFQALHDDLARGVLSIVCMHFDDRVDTTEHFRLIVGYDAARDEVIYQEPAENDGATGACPGARSCGSGRCRGTRRPGRSSVSASSRGPSTPWLDPRPDRASRPPTTRSTCWLCARGSAKASRCAWSRRS